ncbi:MAG: alpha amylase C-terminal domain-containing protein [Flavobacteriales bacterium]|nr:alpha amylase C-terminal domain-containing protein [Flavobacteriales bacterium]
MELKLIENDPYLKPYESQINNRYQWYQNTLNHINHHFGSLENFADGYKYFGFNYDDKKKGYWFRDWLPNALEVYLIGDFNKWNRTSHSLEKNEFGVWEIFLNETEIAPFSKIKMRVVTSNGAFERIPAYIKSVQQNEDKSFDGQFVPKSCFEWTDSNFKFKDVPYIYEAHIGMATEEYKVGTYKEFTKEVLPRIKSLGYNAVQLMAVQEHPYYGSFGYQVSNFFAPSSRFGTPDDLRKLIDTAHGMGLAVILDVVHSHAVRNFDEGLTDLDGTDLYFNGFHPDWDSRLFDYGRLEVKRFLLSNLKYWMDEFHFDGFRFDGVTSMLYTHFGHKGFGNYDDYFHDTNNDAILYLQLANQLIHKVNPNVISIAEDMSGMPGACRPVEEGGLGFDYRLAMGIADYWMDLLETTQDEDWNITDMYYRLNNRRYGEKNIAYAESHDQALVGDKTIAFWLMDKEMYTSMSVFTESLIVDRGIALHKMIRFVTLIVGGEGYMNFIGNEFAHPEWVDFPREGNNWSYHYARRQWSLPDTDHLKYKYLQAFDAAMIHFSRQRKLVSDEFSYKIYDHNEHKILILTKSNLIFAFNFSNNSYADYSFYYEGKGNLKIIFNSDDKAFGGFDRIDYNVSYPIVNNHITAYFPSRTVLVYAKEI